MVIPVVHDTSIACDQNSGELQDPRQEPAELSRMLPTIKVYKANLDGKPINTFNSHTVFTQDGDLDSRLDVDSTCLGYIDLFFSLDKVQGCPLGAAGHYVFINTGNLSKGKHELLLIGEAETADGPLCSAVKHKFTVV